MLKRFAMIFLAMMLITSTSFAATINVPDDEATLSDAVAAAVNGDVIVLAEGDYSDNVTLTVGVTIMGSGVVTLTPAAAAPIIAVELVLSTQTVVIKGITFELDNGETAIQAGANAITTGALNIVGNTFGLVDAGELATALDLSVADVTINNILFSGNVVDGSTVAIDAADADAVLQNIKIYSNVFKNANGITLAASGTVLTTDAFVAPATLDIKGNNFGASVTRGDLYGGFVSSIPAGDLTEAGVHINYNVIRYIQNGAGSPQIRSAVALDSQVDATFNSWGGNFAPATSVPISGTVGVVDAVNFASTNFLTTSNTVIPNVTASGTFDDDGDGKIDAVRLTFDNFLDPNSLSTAGITVSGYTLAKAPRLAMDGDVLKLSVFIAEGENLDTGAIPTVTYTGTGIRDLVAQTVAAFAETPSDEVAPQVVSAVTGDINSNGKIDQIKVTFSEPMKTINSAAWTLGIDLSASLVNPEGAAYTINAGSAVQSPANVVTFIINEFVPTGADLYDTEVTPSFVLNTPGSQMDVASNPLVALTVNSTDGAKPVAVSATTADANADGYIETFNITFSEAITSAAGSDPKLSASTVENSITIPDDAVTNDAGDVLTVTGTNNMSTALVSLHPWDTDAKPVLTLDGTASDVTDNSAAANTWSAFLDGAVTIATTDLALPVLVQAEGMQGTNDLYLTFSEAVTGSGDDINDDFKQIVSGDITFTYNDNGNADGGVTAINLIDPIVDGNGTDAIVVLNMNGNFAARDFDDSSAQGITNPDNIDVSSAVIKDIEANALVAVAAFDIIVYDVTAPTIDRVRTKDLDMDGWVDHIYVRFTENIIDAGIMGYTDGKGINTGAAAYIAVEGYTVVGINNLNTGNWLNNQGNVVYSNWDDATTAAGPNVAKNAASRAILPTETAAVGGLTGTAGAAIDRGDVLNDNTMWIMVKEQSDTLNVAGDTDAIPAVTILGTDANGIRFADKKLNYVATVTNRVADDYAPPAIMSAAMQSFYIMNVAFSESLANPQTISQSALTGGPDFTVLYNGQSDISQKINSIAFGSSNEQLVFNFMDDTPIEYGKNAMIAFNLTGRIKDPAGRGNTQVDDNWNAGAEAIGENGSYITASVAAATNNNTMRPGSLQVLDLAGDNGFYAQVGFSPATNPDVKSYQFYYRNAAGMYILIGEEPPAYVETDGRMYYGIPVPVNGTANIGVRGYTGEAVSNQRTGTGVVTAKVAGLTMVSKVDEAYAAKMAIANVGSDLATAEGEIIDNLGFAPISSFSIADNAGAGTGILISWVAPPNHAENATGYQIWRRAAGTTGDFFKVTDLPIGTTEYVHKIKDSTTAYEYKIVTVDNNVDHTRETAVRTVFAFAGGADFDSSGLVDFADFSAFASNWMTSSASNPTGFLAAYDMTGDGVVDFSDFSIFASLFGQTSVSAAKLATSIPTTDTAFGLAAEIDEASSMYYVTVSVDQAINGLSYSLAYDNSALEFVDSSVSGLSGLHLVSATDGMVQVVAEFIGEQFDGAITLGFKSKGVESDLDFDIVNGLIDGAEGVMASTNLGSVSLRALPTVYALTQNFPNPFNPTTTIEYQIPQSGHVELVVYNMAGQKVRTLVSETQNAAFYKAVWDGRNDTGESVASGLYFYKLVSGNFSKIEKMTLLK